MPCSIRPRQGGISSGTTKSHEFLGRMLEVAARILTPPPPATNSPTGWRIRQITEELVRAEIKKAAAKRGRRLPCWTDRKSG